MWHGKAGPAALEVQLICIEAALGLGVAEPLAVFEAGVSVTRRAPRVLGLRVRSAPSAALAALAGFAWLFGLSSIRLRVRLLAAGV